MIESKLLQSGITKIAGVDEAGRGPCAGPLVVSAVILKDPTSSELDGVRDSKELSAPQRDRMYEVILNNSIAYSIIEFSAAEIDLLGLHKCNLEGMRRAVHALGASSMSGSSIRGKSGGIFLMVNVSRRFLESMKWL